MLPPRAWTVVSATSLIASLVMILPTGLLVRDPAPLIHVRWVESLDAVERGAQEAVLHLEDGEQVGPETWRYELTDASRDHVRQIVEHAAVADTHYVDRTIFAVHPDAPVALRRPGPLGRLWPRAARALADDGPSILPSCRRGSRRGDSRSSGWCSG